MRAGRSGSAGRPDVPEKQSGVRGVTWDLGSKLWNGTWRCYERGEATRKASVKRFPAAEFQQPGQDPEMLARLTSARRSLRKCWTP